MKLLMSKIFIEAYELPDFNKFVFKYHKLNVKQYYRHLMALLDKYTVPTNLIPCDWQKPIMNWLAS